MKIVHLCLGNFFMDGASYQENILTKYHSKMGHNVTVIASLLSYGPNGKGIILDRPRTYVNSDGVKIVRLAFAKPFFYGHFMMKYIGVKEALEEESPDIIFSHNLQFGDTGIVAQYLDRHLGVRLYADNHADYVNSARNLCSRLIKHRIMWKHYVKVIEPYLSKVYGVTPLRCRFLKEMYGVNPALIEFLPMGVDDEAIPINREEVRSRVRAELGIHDSDVLFFTGGKIERRKNTHCIYEAMEKIADPKLHLVVCGTFTPEMSFWEEKMKTRKNITLLGWCDADRVMDIMIASDFVCFPGTHSTLWEQSVGVGLPGIFKRWEGMEHVNINGNCIFVVGDDVDEIANAIIKLSDRDNLLNYTMLAKQAAPSFLFSDIAKKAIDIVEDGID